MEFYSGVTEPFGHFTEGFLLRRLYPRSEGPSRESSICEYALKGGPNVCASEGRLGLALPMKLPQR
jgi:hypothetical protein